MTRRSRSNVVSRGVTLVPLMLAAVLPARVSAQATPRAAPAAPMIAEVIVTAQKRSERLQDVPISVDVVSGDALRARATTGLGDLSQQLPSVFVAESAQGDRLSIRGIGTGDNISTYDQSVATFIDGIYHGRSRGIEGQLLDLDSVEVLKGPQTTYFGNNAIAGAFNITTKNPGSAVSGFARAFYNFTFNDRQIEAAIGGPLTDTLSVRAAYLNAGGDGWINDVAAGVRVPATNNNVGRLTAVWRPNDRFSVNLKAEIADEHEVGAIPEKLIDCPPLAGFPGPAGFCKNALAAGQDTGLNYVRAETAGQGETYLSQEYTGNAIYDAGPVTFTSVSGYWKYKYGMGLDVDGTAPQLFSALFEEKYHQFTQEFRVASRTGGHVEYLAGLYYQDDNLAGQTGYNYSFISPKIASLAAFAPLIPYLPLGQSDAYDQHENVYAAFGSLSWNVTDRLKITGGMRATSVKKSAILTTQFGTAATAFGETAAFPAALQPLGNTLGKALALGFPGSRNVVRLDKHISPSLNAQYHFTRDLMIYASYANGFLAGGFNPGEHSGIQNNLYFGPETVNSYEVGAKSQWLDHRLVLNVDLFYSDYKNLQVSASQTTGVAVIAVVTNAAAAVSKGAEIDGRFILDDHFTAGLSFSLLDSHYQSFPNASPTPLETLGGLTAIDLSGAPTRYAPKRSGNLDIVYSTALSSELKFSLTGNVFFTSSYNISNNNDPFLAQSAYGQLDVIAALADRRRGLELSLLLKNLDNAYVRSFGTTVPSSPGSYFIAPQAPRSVSVQLRYAF